MSKIIDLTGQKFGRLTVLHKDTERITKSGSYWICQCECGKQKSVKSSSLRRGEIISCGCYRTERIMATKEAKGLVDNLIGQRFGFLTVIEKDIQKGAGGAIKWICRCDCGNIVSVQGGNLKRKDESRIVSCGCKHVSIGELNIRQCLEENDIPFSEQQGFASLPRKHFDFAILDNLNNIIRLVEFDGEQHFKENSFFRNNLSIIQQRDKEKNEWAKENNIPLVRIPYWERDNITLDMILGDKYLVC